LKLEARRAKLSQEVEDLLSVVRAEAVGTHVFSFFSGNLVKRSPEVAADLITVVSQGETS